MAEREAARSAPRAPGRHDLTVAARLAPPEARQGQHPGHDHRDGLPDIWRPAPRAAAQLYWHDGDRRARWVAAVCFVVVICTIVLSALAHGRHA